MQDLETIVARALAEMGAAGDAAALENAKARYLGKSGELTALLKALRELSPEERRSAGTRINQAKETLERALERRRGEVAQARTEARLAAEALDVTL
ncbi:MAG: phenylalanine--tRNA ligase subunit alpha, partial [Burkholderiales bacterium]